MSDEVTTEYRAVWPNGDEVWENYYPTDNREFMREYQELIDNLCKLGVPGEGHPWIEYRTVTVTRTTTDWDTIDPGKKPKHADTQPLVTSGPAYENQGPIEYPRTPWPTLDWQIVQVANHRHAFSDPCIICAGDFSSCGHTPDETKALINRIKREHHV